MDLTNKENIKQILRSSGMQANKKLGQHFLISQTALDKIIASAQLKKNDTVLEIGPGLGVLTKELLKTVKLVLAIEKDRVLGERLRQVYKGSNKQLKVIIDNALFFDETTIKDKYKVVANIPYNITTALIRKFLESSNPPTEMVLLIQKEVAERLVAKPGIRSRGFITVMVETYAQAEIVDLVPKEAFWPVPEVDSAIIKLKIADSKQLSAFSQIDKQAFLKFVKIGFSQKRRQIHHPLKAGLKMPKDKVLELLKKARLDSTKRAEELSLEDWVKLFKLVN